MPLINRTIPKNEKTLYKKGNPAKQESYRRIILFRRYINCRNSVKQIILSKGTKVEILIKKENTPYPLGSISGTH